MRKRNMNESIRVQHTRFGIVSFVIDQKGFIRLIRWSKGIKAYKVLGYYKCKPRSLLKKHFN